MSADVTIGVAVYNAEATLCRALDSFLAQTYPNFKILISDNGSTDGSTAICERYAAQDSRVQHIRREETLHVMDNFRHLLELADTPYFMWAAPDDFWGHDFIEAHHAFLEKNEDYVASACRVLFCENGVPTRLSSGTYPLRESAAKNTAAFFANPADNSRFYGLYRTAPLKECYPQERCYAFDWLVCGRTLRYGKHNEIADLLMMRDETDPVKYGNSVERYSSTRLYKMFPVLQISWMALADKPVVFSPTLLWSLLKLNIRMTLRFASFHAYQWASRETPRRWPVDTVARLMRKAFAPGMKTRLRSLLGQDNVATDTHEGPLLEGWALPPKAEASDTAVVLVARDNLLAVLNALHHAGKISAGTTTDFWVINLGSGDVTSTAFAEAEGVSVYKATRADTLGTAFLGLCGQLHTKRVVLLDVECTNSWRNMSLGFGEAAQQNQSSAKKGVLSAERRVLLEKKPELSGTDSFSDLADQLNKL